VEIVYLLIPVSLVLVAVIVWVLLWAVHSGQFDDLEGPAYRILMDDDGPRTAVPPRLAAGAGQAQGEKSLPPPKEEG
jgi:cbb3-type cytochrome oxidase maturation protein